MVLLDDEDDKDWILKLKEIKVVFKEICGDVIVNELKNGVKEESGNIRRNEKELEVENDVDK